MVILLLCCARKLTYFNRGAIVSHIIIATVKNKNKGNKMKLFKVISLAVLGLFLVNCDNSKSTVNDLQQKAEQAGAEISDKAKDLYQQTKSQTQDILDKVKEGNYNLAQDLAIKGIKQELPLTIDQNTALVDVSKDDKTINYKYAVNGIAKEAFDSDSNQKMVFNKLLDVYCSKDVTVNAIKLAFPNGANHNYYINDDKVLSLNVKPSDCDNR